MLTRFPSQQFGVCRKSSYWYVFIEEGTCNEVRTCCRCGRRWGRTSPAGLFQLLQLFAVRRSDTSEVLDMIARCEKGNLKHETRLTLGLVPLRTVLRSLSSTSFCLIFLTTSASWASATYRRFEGVAVAASGARERGVTGAWPPVVLGGVPGGVDVSAAGKHT
jgi:hypothetical protein